MADSQQPSGFKIPPPSGGSEKASPEPPRPAGDSKTTAGTEVSKPPVDVGKPDTGMRDMVIGCAVLLVLVVAFFIAKNAYANYLVSRRVAPRSANAAGWWLFILLTSLATIAVLGFVNPDTFLALTFVVPLGLVAIVSLVLTIVSSRR